MNLADLLKSHGDDEPSGENLEYDPAFISLELAAQPGEERQIGDAIIAAEDPDHAEVIAQAMDVLGRSHDLRAAVFLAYSLLRTRGFPGLAEATGYIRGVLDQFWDTCHPQLDAEDDNDPTMRRNAVLSLAGSVDTPSTILRDVRNTPLTDSRTFGRITLREMLIAEGEIAMSESGPNQPDIAQINAAFQDTSAEKLAATRAAVAKAHEDIEAIEAIFDERLPGIGIDLSLLERALRAVLQRFNAAGYTGEEGGADDADGGGDDASDGGGSPASGPSSGRPSGPAFSAAPGSISNQQDVRAALERIIGYYARAEPSSPVPLLLERAKRMVGADFLTIIKEMAPEGQANVYLIGGISENEDD